MTRTTPKFNFSVHAIEQMNMRLGVTIDIDTRFEILEYLETITNKEAYDIVGDPVILSERNRKTSKYYLLDFNNAYVLDALYYSGYNVEQFTDILAILVVREGCCVTFKTNTESEIFSNLKDLRCSSRSNSEGRFSKYYEFNN